MQTNYEKIKAMNIDEMAEWLTNWCKIFADSVYESEVLMLGYVKCTTDEYKKLPDNGLKVRLNE